MKVSMISIFLALVLFAASTALYFTIYKTKEYISYAASYAQTNYSPNVIISEITSAKI